MPAHCSFSPTTIHHTGRGRCFLIVGLVVSIALYLRLFLLIFPSEGCVLDLKVQSQYISYPSTQRTYHFSCCVPTFSLRVSLARRTVATTLRYWPSRHFPGDERTERLSSFLLQIPYPRIILLQ